MTNKVTISDDQDETESVDVYICARASAPSVFADDLYDFCCECGEKVRYRPHGPSTPKKLCLECALPRLQKEAEAGNLNVVLNSKTAEEIKPYITKKN